MLLDLHAGASRVAPQLSAPPGLVASARATWLGRMVNEHGSARVFEGLAGQILGAGLDASLAQECRGFADEERRHGLLCGAVVEALGGRVRGGGPLVRLVQDFLARPSSRGALVAACDDEDPIVRRAAFALRTRSEPVAPVLAAALADRDTGIRHWAARTAISRATTDDDKRALVPLLEASRSPTTRALAYRARERFDTSDEFLESALLDHNAAVRFLARALLRRRHPERAFGETRARALAVLDATNTAANETIGALGALADVGLAEDASVVARFSRDPRPRVRAEAERTASLLGVSASSRETA